MGTTNQLHADDSKEILLVEDHAETAAMLTALLEDEGYTVRWVDKAGDALSFFPGSAAAAQDGERQPDLIILDLMLPDRDPVELMRRLSRTMKPGGGGICQPYAGGRRGRPNDWGRSSGFQTLPLDTLLQSIDAALFS